MDKNRKVRYAVIAVILLFGVYWSLASARPDSDYPESDYLVSGAWLKQHTNDTGLLIVDVREEKYFDGKLIPGAIRLPWGDFRYNNVVIGIGGIFIGPDRVQEVLGNHGISRNDTLILYDSVERDGGATASYVFWILDLLGHEKKKVLEGGIDGWLAAGGDVVSEPKRLEPTLYQAMLEEIRLRSWVDGEFILKRLGDPYYQIVDVRSRQEYLGEKPNVGLDGQILKLGHIPTAVNVDYRLNWTDAETKTLKSYEQLQELYRGLDPTKGVIVYCHSGRRSSFSYYVLRLMGFDDVLLYDRSWNEWGNSRTYFPVETRENRLSGSSLPGPGTTSTMARPSKQKRPTMEDPKGGYVSCGG
jgi:thiosulfate/3-mercaptopyruvate sulfurtransferase